MKSFDEKNKVSRLWWKGRFLKFGRVTMGWL